MREDGSSARMFAHLMLAPPQRIYYAVGMDKNYLQSLTFETELLALRSQIDSLDDKLIALLLERIAVVKKVGELKRKNAADLCPIRPGREAEMVRRIMDKFVGSHFTPIAAAAIWRIIIGTSTAAEAELKISVLSPERENDLFWLARDYFGPSVSINKQPQVKRVIGDIMDGKAGVGIVPTLNSADTSYWWTNLVQPGQDTPKIFAHIPFVLPSTPDRNAACGFAIARIIPEASGDDISLIVLEAEHNVSQHKLQMAFQQAALDVNWISIATIHPICRHHLLEIKGFITAEHPGMQTLMAALGGAVQQISYIGAYATPVGFSLMKNEKGIPHASGIAK